MSVSEPPRRLLASIHDVGPRFEAEIDRLAEGFERRLGGPHFAMLVVPDHWGEAPLSRDSAFQARLRGWADRGVEMFVHGWSYRVDQSHEGALAAFKARRMTAGEGEFLGLGRAEAARRMRDGRALIEDVIGRPVAGFIAPAWLYGEGALRALADEGFAIAEDHLKVWRPVDGATLVRGPVVTWASRSRARKASSLAFAALARVALRPLPVVRLAVHPGDTSSRALLADIDRTLAAFLADRVPGRYGDLMGK